jgi:uncharacterized damage-inducible protein DinB
MTDTERISDQLRRAVSGGAWHGPSVDELLSGVDAAAAAARPLPQAHSIWEILLHMTVWLEVVRRRVTEGRAIEPPPAEDWPAPGQPTEAAWQAAVERHERAYRDLAGFLSRLDDEELKERVAGKDYDAAIMLYGIVQHELYHAGQIALLKKAAV